MDPVAAAAKPSEQSFAHVRLAASAAPVTIRFVNAAPQSITVLDEDTNADLYHLSSAFGPGHPQVDEGFVQVFLAQLHNDASQQLVLGSGNCKPTCAGASQLKVLSMNADHRVVIEQLRLEGLVNAVADVRGGSLLVSEWSDATVTLGAAIRLGHTADGDRRAVAALFPALRARCDHQDAVEYRAMSARRGFGEDRT